MRPFASQMRRPLAGGTRAFTRAGGWAAALLCAAPLAQAQGSPSPAHAAPTQPPSPAQIKSHGSYSLGVSMGEMLRRASLSTHDVSTPRLLQGLRDALAGKARMSAADQQNIQAMFLTARARVGNANHTAAKAFLARNGKKKGVVTTASGLEYEVLRPGQGGTPGPGDLVTVNYRATLLDGTEIDSSYKHGQPATFAVDRVIPGWREALQLMKPGAKFRLFIPPQLAYDINSPPPIPPGSLLVFEVELLRVQPRQPSPPMPLPGVSQHR